MKTIIESQYFPSLEYFSFLKSQKEVYIEQYEYFVKQTYRNRCYIMAADRVLPLSVPVVGGNKKTVINKIEIDYKDNWIKDHWRSIISAYNKSPFFEYYEPYLKEIIFNRPKYLLTLNMDILKFCLKVTNIDVSIMSSDSYLNSNNKNLNDMRSVIHPKKTFESRNIYVEKPYKQLFSETFVPNLSILDLLACKGPEANSFL